MDDPTSSLSLYPSLSPFVPPFLLCLCSFHSVCCSLLAGRSRFTLPSQTISPIHRLREEHWRPKARANPNSSHNMSATNHLQPYIQDGNADGIIREGCTARIVNSYSPSSFFLSLHSSIRLYISSNDFLSLVRHISITRHIFILTNTLQ